MRLLAMPKGGSSMRRVIVALIVGFALGLGSVATAAQTTNFPLQTWLGVQTIKTRVGNPNTYSGTGTIAGEIGDLSREVDALQTKMSSLCAIHGARC
jgi:hypothetical protein